MYLSGARKDLFSAFTLIELLITISILLTLAAITLVAINPSRMFGQATQTKRQSDAVVLGKAIDQYVIDQRGAVPNQLLPLETPKPVARNSGGAEADICSLLVPNFIPALPVDPSISGSSYITNCSATYSTGYYAIANRFGKIGVYSPTGDLLIANYGAVPDAYLTPVSGDPTATPTPSLTPAPVLVSGSLTIQGRTNKSGASVTFTGTPGTYNTTTDTNGNYSLTIPTGDYTAVADINLYLSRSKSITISGPTTMTTPDYLRGGDANGDGTVSSLDNDIVGANFNLTCASPGFDARADFNADCTVNIFDMVMVGGNTGQVEPMAW